VTSSGFPLSTEELPTDHRFRDTDRPARDGAGTRRFLFLRYLRDAV